MLPNFLIIGAQKAATSWLATCLSEHPHVFMPPEKEIFFFDQYYDRGLTWYDSYFDAWHHETVGGEATPNYLNHMQAPYRIREALGENVKMIASLRHPVDRAYSAFWHYVRRGFFPKDADFEQYFVENGRFELRSRGYYFEHLQRYYSIFPKENILILIQEQFKDESEEIISQCFSFLKVDPTFSPYSLNQNVNQGGRILLFHSQIYKVRQAIKSFPDEWQRAFVALGSKFIDLLPTAHQPAKLDATLRESLFNEYYAEDTARLSELIGKELSTWQTSSLVE